MIAIGLLLLLLQSLLNFRTLFALDVSWIPTDANDGPLPLSTKYRNNLRKLCNMMKQPNPPPELLAKATALKKMCQRLESDDRNVASSSGDGSLTANLRTVVLIGLAGIGISYYAWQERRMIIRTVRSWIKPLFSRATKRYRLGGDDDVPDISSSNDQMLREARLKRFAVDADPAIIEKLD
jgi:hypothetical protein